MNMHIFRWVDIEITVRVHDLNTRQTSVRGLSVFQCNELADLDEPSYFSEQHFCGVANSTIVKVLQGRKWVRTYPPQYDPWFSQGLYTIQRKGHS